MKFPAAALLLAASVLLVGATPPPVPAPPDAPPPASDASQARDYTSRSMDPPLAPEFDPAQAPPPPAYAEAPDEDGLRECVGPDGVPIFTDRRCGDMGATPRPPHPTPGGALAPGQPMRVRSCARNQGDLLAGVRAALESHDANRLADYYHWTGMGTSEGYRLMARLDSFSARPVVDVQLVRNAPPPESDPYGYGFDYGEPTPPPQDEGADPLDPEAPAPPPRRRPLASMLRVDQMRSNEDVASTITYFHLLTNAGCWWMRF
jgi:hypothetical protein